MILINYMKRRLKGIEDIAKQGVIPDQVDSFDLEQAIGRIKELKRTIFVAQKMTNNWLQFKSPECPELGIRGNSGIFILKGYNYPVTGYINHDGGHHNPTSKWWNYFLNFAAFDDVGLYEHRECDLDDILLWMPMPSFPGLDSKKLLENI